MQRDQRGHVVDVLEAPRGPSRGRSGTTGTCEATSSSCADRLALLPQRRAPAGVAAREQQRPRRALAEAGGEQRRAADLGGHDLLDLVGLERDQLGARRILVGLGDAQHDAVVGGHRLGVHAVALAQPRVDRQRPGRVDRHAVGRVHDDPPVAELVAEPLDHQLRSCGHRVGRLALLLEEGDQVVGGPLVEAGVASRGRVRRRPGHRRDLAGEGADRPRPSSAGRPRVSPFQNGSRPGWPGAGETSTRSWVMSSIRQLVVPRVNTSPTRDS